MVDRNVAQRRIAEARKRDGWFVEISRLIAEWYSSRSEVSIVAHVKWNSIPYHGDLSLRSGATRLGQASIFDAARMWDSLALA
jgi:hypothetical protein